MNIWILVVIIILIILILILIQRISLSKINIENVPPVVVSLTTSPKRIHHIYPVIDSILHQTIPVSYIQLNLPKVFKRTSETFGSIPAFLHHEKIKIRFVDDIGPITKILPTLQEKFTDETLILSIDDDTFYGNNMIETILKYHEKFPSHVLTGNGGQTSLMDSNVFPLLHEKGKVVEGFAGVVYPYKLFKNINIDLNLPKECYFSDDFILSNYIHNQKIPIISLKFLKIRMFDFKQLNFGFEGDALHKNVEQTNNQKKIDSIHPHNYKTCAIHYHSKNQLADELSYWLSE